MPHAATETLLTGLIATIADDINSLPQSDQAVLFLHFGYGSAGHISDDALVSDHVASTELGVTTTTLAIWRSTGRYHLPFVKMGRLVKYVMSDIREFKRRRRIDTRPGEQTE